MPAFPGKLDQPGTSTAELYTGWRVHLIGEASEGYLPWVIVSGRKPAIEHKMRIAKSCVLKDSTTIIDVSRKTPAYFQAEVSLI
jgi:hypothetical protein